MPKKDKEGPTQSTDAFEFIVRMAQRRQDETEPEEKDAVEELEIQNSRLPKPEQ